MATNDPAFLAAVTPKLPDFYVHSPKLWFGRAETEFETCTPVITAEKTKFNYVVKALDEPTALRVADLIESPPPEQPYTQLKNRLLNIFSLSDRERASRILDYPQLGDSSTAKMVDDIILWQGSDGYELLVKELMFRHLPDNIRVVLENDPTKDLRELARKADQLRQTASSTLAAVRPQPQTPATAQTKQPTQNSGATGQICRLHRKWGYQARKCIPPCIFHKPENDDAGRQ